MIRDIRRHVGATLTLAALAFVATGAFAPAAEAVPKSTSNEAKWVSFDPEAKTVVVEIGDRGKGPNTDMVKRGDKQTFNVKPSGSILTRTVVKINGQAAELADIKEGRTVNIRWIPDPDAEGELFAKGVDVVISEEEFERRYETE